MSLKTVWLIARKELRDALHNHWFMLYTVAFVGLALALSYLSLAGAGITGTAGYGRTAASLINLVLLIVPLIALTMGAQSLAGEQERRTLSYLLAQPITRLEVFTGKYVGLALSLLVSIALGFGISGLVLAMNGSAGDPLVYVGLALLAFLLSLVMLSVGMLVSSASQRVGVAIGVGLFLWLVFVFVGDLGLMGTAITMQLPIGTLFWLALVNPLQVFKMTAILQLNATLDLLGPAGIFAVREYGTALLPIFLGVTAAWILVPAGAAYAHFARKSDL